MASAALLCKADLASALVGEFPELQGTIGKYYALAQKEEREVAEAIEEHWMPRAENAPLPKTATGIILSLADKIDNLIGCYSVGLKPSSSSDPYALRRQSIGILKILIEGKESVDLKRILEEAANAFANLKSNPLQTAAIVQEILAFITARAKSVFEEYGFKKDEIDASLQGLCIDPFDQFCKTQALHDFRSIGHRICQTLRSVQTRQRSARKTRHRLFSSSSCHSSPPKKNSCMRSTSAKTLERDPQRRKYLEAFRMIAKLQPPLAKLFDTVKILADDPELRDNRIALLQKVFAPFQELLDFSKIQEI